MIIILVIVRVLTVIAMVVTSNVPFELESRLHFFMIDA